MQELHAGVDINFKTNRPAGPVTLNIYRPRQESTGPAGEALLNSNTAYECRWYLRTEMASLLQPDRVLYLVRGEKRTRAPLSQLYFCRYCIELRSLECVSHEVDSHYCPSCLENMPSAEAKLKKNRCANCFDCPSCMHTLSTRATNIPAPLPDDPSKTTMKKAYYLACGFCRWTSRDVGMADKSVASGGWQEPENPHVQRISKLIDYYQQLAHREKQERDRKKKFGCSTWHNVNTRDAPIRFFAADHRYRYQRMLITDTDHVDWPEIFYNIIMSATNYIIWE
uniref:Dynactin subunit 4 n=2 Tax=Nothobranchius TaxID=28779 RepID=A0A1A8ICQ9_NOTKU